MGIVYEAEHVILRQRVAVKVLLPGAVPSNEALERFSSEAAAIARISCEHVVRVTDAGMLPNDAPYLVMEYLEGQNLEELVRGRGPLPVVEAVDYALQTLEALAHVHAAHVIHRDLKSANLFIARIPDGRHIVKLVDFGIAITADAAEEDGRIVGSPAYMSPEQLCRDPIDSRTDLWSLGVVLHELLCGETPFQGNLSELVQAVLHQPIKPIHERVPRIPPGLSEVIARCLSRDPNGRWASAATLARALAPFGPASAISTVERIHRALANTSPRNERRRFETLETALSALDEKKADGKSDVETEPPPKTPGAFGATMPAPSAAPTDPPNALRIALIDDSSFVLSIHSVLLSTAGFAVRTTTSPTELLRIVETWQPHLVLMDVQMPGAPGDQLCRGIKARYKAKLPIVFVSQLPVSELEVRAAAGGADAFFSKTSDGAAFVDFVRNVCAITYSPEHLP